MGRDYLCPVRYARAKMLQVELEARWTGALGKAGRWEEVMVTEGFLELLSGRRAADHKD